MTNDRSSLGYKQTAIGLIPEDWRVVAISEIADISVGKDVNEAHFSSVQDSRYKYPVYSNTVDNEGLYGYYDYPEFSGDSLTVVGRGVGLGTAFSRTDSFGAIGRLVVIFPIPECNNRFLANYINHKLKIFSESSGVPQLTGIGLAKYKVALPPLPEQRSIAQALSDVDALIAALDKTIAKKRAIKTATMQQLLTGKKRLPGFGEEKGYKESEIGLLPEDWETDKIGVLASITTGSRNTQDRLDNGKYPFFVRSQTVERINSYSFDGEAVLTAGDGVGTGKVFHYINGKFDTHQRVYRISHFKPELNGFFFYKYFSNHFYNRIMSMTAKSSVDSIRMEMIANMILPLPKPKEQRSITTVLSDMDAEIAAIEARLAKTQAIKQGMMQELLTGRTRLV